MSPDGPGSRPVGSRVRPDVLLAIGAGGAVGGVARYGIAEALPVAPGAFPWATWWVNVTGSLVLGVLVTLVVERWPPTRYVRPFAGIGVCGGYTTWSTFMTESALLVRDRHVAVAVAYLAATVAGGLAATAAGAWLARLWPTAPATPPGEDVVSDRQAGDERRRGGRHGGRPDGEAGPGGDHDRGDDGRRLAPGLDRGSRLDRGSAGGRRRGRGPSPGGDR